MCYSTRAVKSGASTVANRAAAIHAASDPVNCYVTTNDMKILSLTLLAALALVAISIAAPIGQFKTKVVLAWNYPTNEYQTNFSFSIYHSTNALIPLTNWTRITNIAFIGPVTNLPVTGTNYDFSTTLPTIAGVHFFIMTVSNSWGESSFSNVAGTPPVPRDDGKFTATPTE